MSSPEASGLNLERHLNKLKKALTAFVLFSDTLQLIKLNVTDAGESTTATHTLINV